MKIALIQQLSTNDKKENLYKGLQALKKAAQQEANIVCFSELAFEPFYPQLRAKSNVLELAETIPGPTTKAFASLAAHLNVVVVLNLFERDGNNTYDTTPVINTDGKLLGKTRMVHIPDYDRFHERSYYKQGDLGAPVYNTVFSKIGIAICYDRHFPEYMRALRLAGAEVVIVPQAGIVDEWPNNLYRAEMQVASFQNGYFIALCNRIGKESKLEFAGESFVCNPEGKVIAQASRGTEEILICDLDLNLVNESYAKKLFLRDRRPDLYSDWFSRND
jgi:N-carbamoylputrescine amidase